MRKKAALPPSKVTVTKMTLGMKGRSSPVIFTSGAVMLPTRAHRVVMPKPVCLGKSRAEIGNLYISFLKEWLWDSWWGGAGGCQSFP